MKHQKIAYLTTVALFLGVTACQPLVLPEFPPAAVDPQPTSAPSAPQPSIDSSTQEPTDIVVAAAAGADTLGDSIYPGMGNGGYDVTHYTLDLTVDVPNNLLEATATIDATTTQALSAFNLDFHGLTVERIAVDGEEATFSRNGDELTITPANPLAESTTFTVLVAYSGSPQPISDPSAPTDIGWNFSGSAIYVVSEPAGAKTWFPSNNHPLDKATYTIQITTDSAYTAAATGRLVNTTEDGDSTTTLWEMNDPMATYLSAIYIGDYIREESQGPDGLLIRNYFPPDMPDEEKESFNQTAGIIEFYNNLFGPYPFDAYGTIVVDEPLGYALENQTLSIHGRYTTDIYILAHEIMHQWTGNHVSPGDWQDVWLNEGFAFYLPFLYLDSIGAVDVDTLMARFYADIESGGSIGSATVGATQLFDSASVYRRGGLTLYALHQQVGDDAFRSIMRRYYETFGGRAATTADFIAVAESIGGPEVRPLLNGWLYEDKLPELSK